MGERVYTAADGTRWKARVISGGKSSGYLNEKVQRPIVEFRRAAGAGPPLYAMIPRKMSIEFSELDATQLGKLFAGAKSH